MTKHWWINTIIEIWKNLMTNLIHYYLTKWKDKTQHMINQRLRIKIYTWSHLMHYSIIRHLRIWFSWKINSQVRNHSILEWNPDQLLTLFIKIMTINIITIIKFRLPEIFLSKIIIRMLKVINHLRINQKKIYQLLII